MPVMRKELSTAALAVLLVAASAATARAGPNLSSDAAHQHLSTAVAAKINETDGSSLALPSPSASPEDGASIPSPEASADGKSNTSHTHTGTPEDYGSCASHPGTYPGLKPVLLRSWMFPIRVERNRSHFQPSFYVPRFDNVTYVESGKPTSGIYNALDFFSPGFFPAPGFNSPRAVVVKLNRPARVYLLIQARYDRENPGNATLPGYTSQGWAEIPKGGNNEVKYGVYTTASRKLSTRVYVVRKDASKAVDLPDFIWLRENLKGIADVVSYSILLAEADGGASVAPESPPGVGTIQAGGRCPQTLHDLWKTPGVDASDPDTVGKVFSTWHPLWDPCYYCAYDHEHGSNAGLLLGVRPAYSLPAWKNNRQDEYHNGFKVSGRRTIERLVLVCAVIPISPLVLIPQCSCLFSWLSLTWSPTVHCFQARQ
jgi:hypothetical protein